MGGFTKFLFQGFFSFNSVASLDYISLQAGIARPEGGGGGRGQGEFDFFSRRGVQNKFEQKSRGGGKRNSEYIFLRMRG